MWSNCFKFCCWFLIDLPFTECRMFISYVPIFEHLFVTLFLGQLFLTTINTNACAISNQDLITLPSKPKPILIVHIFFLVHETLSTLISESLSKNCDGERILYYFIYCLKYIVLSATICASSVTIISIINIESAQLSAIFKSCLYFIFIILDRFCKMAKFPMVISEEWVTGKHEFEVFFIEHGLPFERSISMKDWIIPHQLSPWYFFVQLFSQIDKPLTKCNRILNLHFEIH